MRRPITALFALALLAAAASALADPYPAPATDPAHALVHLAPGDTVAWVLDTGADGRGVIARVQGAAIRLDDGFALDARDLARLWRWRRSRAGNVGRGVAGGLAVGLVGGLAVGNTLANDDGGFENLAAVLAGLGVFAAGALGGAMVGAAAPPAGTWELLLTDDPDRRPPPQPPCAEAARAAGRHGAYVEGGVDLATVRWRNRSDGAARLTVGLWQGLTADLDGGVSVGFGGTPDFAQDRAWRDKGPLSVAGNLRARLTQGPGACFYLGLGGGTYGQLADTPGWSAAVGVQTLRSGGMSGCLEVGTVGAVRPVGGDKPALVYLALRLDLGLGPNP
ncbi:MAG: hypothetical protein R3D98_17005 [Candidatus Krumholzibacteriia bacterium]